MNQFKRKKNRVVGERFEFGKVWKAEKENRFWFEYKIVREGKEILFMEEVLFEGPGPERSGGPGKVGAFAPTFEKKNTVGENLYLNQVKKEGESNYKINAEVEPIGFAEKNGMKLICLSEGSILSEEIGSMIEALHLILGISYYKIFCPKKIICPYEMDAEKAEFWRTVYKKGLGEMMFLNNLDPKNIGNFRVGAGIKLGLTQKDSGRASDEKILLGIGGGKDSIVAWELLKKHGFDVTPFLLETGKKDQIAEKVMEIMIEDSGKKAVKIFRWLDKKVFERIEGGLNGHIPISAIFCFVGLLAAKLNGFKYFLVGNEHSSNFGNVEYKREIVNHQWSKSAEFEEMVQKYCFKYLSEDVKYFSVLRQFYEIRIAKMFCKMKKYFKVFSSCNKNFTVFKERQKTLWCGQCAKCSFVYLMLAAFLEKEELIEIFGKNLFADAKLVKMYKDLLGFGDLKPFDCVGTFEESRVAMILCKKKFAGDLIIEEMMKLIEVNVKQEEIKNVFRTEKAIGLPSKFRFLGVEKVAILGYGIEGKVTEKYLKMKFPEIELKILDEKLDKNYLEKLKDFDLAVKSPGIPKEKVTIPYVTATNLFLGEIKNLTIGVTGSKGKSTTASLIEHILEEAGKKVRLIGNIGKPMLEVLMEKIDEEEIFVVELSSYMLDDIEYSPKIAVLLNLFPEHMDYHGGIEKYYAAKENIFKFQTKDCVALKFPFKKIEGLKIEETNLLGEHNLRNIEAAAEAARKVGVSEEVILRAVKSFKPLKHRIEFIGEFGGVKFYDDAISTTPESTIMAIKALKDVDTIFLGGTDRGYDFTELEEILREYGVRNVVLFPDSGKRILKNRNGFNILETDKMEEAVKFGAKNTAVGKICLLSTASPSYSLWPGGFQEKGDEFAYYVRQS